MTIGIRTILRDVLDRDILILPILALKVPSMSHISKWETESSQRTEAGGWPPTVSKRKTSSAILPSTFTTSSQATSVFGSVGAGMDALPFATMKASLLPWKNGPEDLKSQTGLTPWPVTGFVMK